MTSVSPDTSESAPRPFDEADPATWETAPDGYAWRAVNGELGEQHLFSPDERDVSAAYYEAEARKHDLGAEDWSDYDTYAREQQAAYDDEWGTR